MDQGNYTHRARAALTVLGALLVLVLLGWAVVPPLLAQAAPPALPPRPTLVPTPTPTVPPAPTATPPPTHPRPLAPTATPIPPPTGTPPPVVLPETGGPVLGVLPWLLFGGLALLAGGALLGAARRRSPGRH
jgi:hypothetical protein